jgi:hypothetical protein
MVDRLATDRPQTADRTGEFARGRSSLGPTYEIRVGDQPKHGKRCSASKVPPTPPARADEVIE